MATPLPESQQASIQVVSSRLGHADVATTLRAYVHILPGDQEWAAVVGSLMPALHDNPTTHNSQK